jgi:hypothetical protein
VGGTILTLIFLPALYALWFRIKSAPEGATRTVNDAPVIRAGLPRNLIEPTGST